MAEPASDPSLWDLHKEFQGLDPDTELPTSLDARRGGPLTRCETCGGTWFAGTIAFDTDGRPARILTPQTCVGCGALRQANWPQ